MFEKEIKKRIRRFLLLLPAVLLLLSAGCAGEEEKEPAVLAETVSGDVSLRHNGNNYTLKSGLALENGDEILTGRVSGCTVAFAEGMKLYMDGNSHIRLAGTEEGLTVPEVLEGCVFFDGFSGNEKLFCGSAAIYPEKDSVFSLEAYTGSQTVNLYQGTVSLDYAEETHILKSGDRITLLQKEDVYTVVHSESISGDLQRFLLEQLIARDGLCFSTEELETILEERLAQIRKDAGEEAESQSAEEEADITCTLEIRCDTVLDNPKWRKDDGPQDGVLLKSREVTYERGDSVFDLLRRVCREEGISLDYDFMPMIGGYYVTGIAGIDEHEYGQMSGWMYKVNGWYPNYGASGYQVREGDVIVWQYTCDGGTDVGQSRWVEKE